jgi:methylthioribulose-1-phosphate dehydratase
VPSNRARLVEIGRSFYSRGWVMGTSGNFSVVTSTRPLRLLITPSAAHKGRLASRDLLQVDERGRPMGRRAGKPSAETLLHLEIVKARGAGAVLHTHSVWSTILSERHQSAKGLTIAGYEMLKGLDGVTTHEHQEWVPILANDQDMPRLASRLRQVLDEHPAAHGVLLAGHGLYTWGKSLDEAERQVEILEFLFQVLGCSGSRVPGFPGTSGSRVPGVAGFSGRRSLISHRT